MKLFQEGMNDALHARNFRNAMYIAGCLILLAYLSSLDLQVTLNFWQSHIKQIRDVDGATHLEELYETQAHILCYHIRRGRAYRPTDVRQALDESLYHLPLNAKIESIRAEVFPWFSFKERLYSTVNGKRAMFDEGRLLAHAAFSLSAEAKRASVSKSTTHSTRNFFESALASAIGNHSPAWWTCYVLHEYNNGNLGFAKTILFRGLSCIPWSKHFAMLAFSHLSEAMSDSELYDIYHTICKRGLRLHIDLEECANA